MNIFYTFDFFSTWLTYKIFGITPNSSFGKTLSYFIQDTLKIFFLIFILLFIVSYFRSYIKKEKIHSFFTHEKKYVALILASVLAIITPSCSCSAIPIFISLIEAGIPIGIAFSFLIASPMINEVALILIFSVYGIKIASIYFLSGFFISFFSGFLLGNIHAEKWVLKDILIKDFSSKKNSNVQIKSKKRFGYAGKYTLLTLKKISLYIVAGIAIGSVIHGYVSKDFFTKHLNFTSWYNVPVAVFLGIPFYINAAGVIPLINSLTEKGLSMGTALAFMMALTGLSLPEFFILKRFMKWKLIIIFISIVAISIIFIGYLFNAFL